jgi:hypothetical protein
MVGERYCISTYHLCWTQLWWYSHRAGSLISHSHREYFLTCQQALVNVISRGECFQYLATSTVRIIFLGTPHRGTLASKWGELIAISGKKFGFGSEDMILRDLCEVSETLTDLLYNFALWLSRMSVTTVCFFEQHKTNYEKRFGFSWTELVRNPGYHSFSSAY